MAQQHEVTAEQPKVEQLQHPVQPHSEKNWEVNLTDGHFKLASISHPESKSDNKPAEHKEPSQKKIEAAI